MHFKKNKTCQDTIKTSKKSLWRYEDTYDVIIKQWDRLSSVDVETHLFSHTYALWVGKAAYIISCLRDNLESYNKNGVLSWDMRIFW